MTLQTLVPLITYPDNSAPETSALAVNVARYLESDIHAITLEPDFLAPTNALARMVVDVPGMLKEIKDACRLRGQTMSRAIAEIAQRENVGFREGRIETIQERFGEVAAIQARYHDLTILGWRKNDEVTHGVAEAIIFGSGRPVLLLPERQDLPSCETVFVAWDGSRAAARAVADADRFLAKATRIVVGTATDEKQIEEPRTAERLADHLTRRGMNAEARGIASNNRPISQTLQEEALAADCGLLVLGGYGHSRLRDFVLGGATKGILDDLRMPVLLSH